MGKLYILLDTEIVKPRLDQKKAWTEWKKKKTEEPFTVKEGKNKFVYRILKFDASFFTKDKVTNEYEDLYILIPQEDGPVPKVISENYKELQSFNKDYQAALAEEEEAPAAAATHSGHGHMLSGWHTAPCTTIGDEAAVWGVGPTGGKRRKTRKHKTRRHKTRKHKTRRHKTRRTRRHKIR